MANESPGTASRPRIGVLLLESVPGRVTVVETMKSVCHSEKRLKSRHLFVLLSVHLFGFGKMYHFTDFLWWSVDDNCCFERCAEPGCHDRLSLGVWQLFGGIVRFECRLGVAKAKLVCTCK